jgi:hypothetical protein
VRAIYNTSVWLQAGQHLALAAQIPATASKAKKRLPEAEAEAPGPSPLLKAD